MEKSYQVELLELDQMVFLKYSLIGLVHTKAG